MLNFVILLIVTAVILGIIYLWRKQGWATASAAAAALGAALWAAGETVVNALMAFAALFGA